MNRLVTAFIGVSLLGTSLVAGSAHPDWAQNNVVLEGTLGLMELVTGFIGLWTTLIAYRMPS